ncbi:cytochrome P450 CYP2 [Heterobasidion irregulare TC 32-1]|uniref:Cytochrome P450 CYP2 n=1 Tax=Heterobasidion irregulare (strain TC 32-1) TaxID=747525 RepID=W4K3A2_HETIT|nr:cytochrome P450 CYP2 [Heterobasidion irregulare TC 32-1]ETW79561.1 cytochrome P450 CYP2 [Heterobasidion irregulare TC 32-1]
MDRRATIYSDRPQNIVPNDLMTGGLLITFTHYNDVWRRLRKAAHEALNKAVAHKYHPTQAVEAVLLTLGVLTDPENWEAHLRRTAVSSIMSMLYDTPPIASEEDPTVQRINDFVIRLTRAALPGAHFVEFFPWMIYIPSKFAKWKRQALDYFAQDSILFEGLFKGVRDRVEQGEDRPSLCASLIEDAGRHGLSERENAWLAGTMYGAATDTNATVMSWWIFAMVLYPEVQKRGQAEIDAVVGRDRLPTFADFDKLPYIRGMVKECLRWRPIDPVGIPHRSTEDDWYEGYFIPAGTTIIANVWHLNRDERIYGPDAKEFNPSRHLDEKGQILPGLADTKDESHFTYGFGRRICVGRHVANNSLFIQIAMMLWAMNIDRPTNETGVPVPMDIEGCVDDGLSVHPIPFNCKITPRHAQAISMLEQEKESHIQ